MAGLLAYLQVHAGFPYALFLLMRVLAPWRSSDTRLFLVPRTKCPVDSVGPKGPGPAFQGPGDRRFVPAFRFPHLEPSLGVCLSLCPAPTVPLATPPPHFCLDAVCLNNYPRVFHEPLPNTGRFAAAATWNGLIELKRAHPED